MPSARTLLSKPRLGSTVSISVLTHRPMRKAIASHTSAASTRGMARAMVLSIAVAGSEIAAICRIWSAPMAAKMMIDRRHGDADRAGDRAARRGDAFAAATPVSSTATGGFAELSPARPTSRSRLSAPSAASMTWRTIRARISPAKKNSPAPSRRGRKANTSLVMLVTGVSTPDRPSGCSAAISPTSHTSQ